MSGLRPSDLARGLSAALEDLGAWRLDRAALGVSRLLAQAPSDPAANQMMALIALTAGDVPAARRHVDLSLKIRSDHAPSWLLAARIAGAEGNPSAAAAALRRAIAIDPGPARPHFDLGKVLFAEGRFGEAEAAFAEAGRREPGSHQAAYNRGLACLQMKDPARARQAFEAAVVIDREFADGWFSLGLVRQDLGDAEGAADAYAQAVAARPGFAEAATNLGLVLQDLRRLPEAIRAYRAAIRADASAYGRIAQALTTASRGRLMLDPGELRHWLTEDAAGDDR